METQTIDNSITFKGFVIACIVLIPHCIFLLWKIIITFFGGRCSDILQTKNAISCFFKAIILLIELITFLQLSVVLLPLYALFACYMLTVGYSQQPFVEATEDAFVNTINVIVGVFELTYSDS